FHRQRHPAVVMLFPDETGRRASRCGITIGAGLTEGANHTVAFLIDDAAHDEDTLGTKQIEEPGGGTDQHGAREIRGDEVGGRQLARGQVSKPELDGFHAGIELQIFVRCLNRVGVVIDTERPCGPRGGEVVDNGERQTRIAWQRDVDGRPITQLPDYPISQFIYPNMSLTRSNRFRSSCSSARGRGWNSSFGSSRASCSSRRFCSFVSLRGVCTCTVATRS